MPKHTVSSTFKDDAGTVPLTGTTYTVDAEVNALIPVAAGAVNVSHVINFAYLKVNDYCLAVVTQTPAQVASGTYSEATAGSILVNVNSTSSPAPAITVNAKVPHVFAACLSGTANEFTADATRFYLNNAGSVDLVLSVKIGLNT